MVSVWSCRGISFCSGGLVMGGAPSPENFGAQICLKMAHFGCIFCHTRDFFAVQRGGGHGPSGPMVNTPMSIHDACECNLVAVCVKCNALCV